MKKSRTGPREITFSVERMPIGQADRPQPIRVELSREPTNYSVVTFAFDKDYWILTIPP